jgi:hypothetical protein
MAIRLIIKNRCEVIFDVCNKYYTFERIKEDFLNKAKSLSNLQDTDIENRQLRQNYLTNEEE